MLPCMACESASEAGLCPACRALAAPPDPPALRGPSPGRGFRGLKIVRLLTRGPRGLLFRALDPASGRPVALKVLPGSLSADESFQERFRSATRDLTALDHPNVVRLLDAGVEEGFPCLVSEFVEGPTLRRLLEERRLARASAARLFPPVCRALEAAHALGIRHGALRPGKIFLTPDGGVKVADFSLAAILRSWGSEAPHHCAPEQIDRPDEADARSDVYSLGVLLYELLTGEVPRGRFAPPSARSGAPVNLDDAVLRALEPDPAQRFQTVSQLREAVERALPGSALPETFSGRLDGNLQVRCRCGWIFYVPASTRSLVNCPSCRGEMALTGSPAVPLPAAAPDRPRSRMPLLVGVAAGALVLLVALTVLAFVRLASPRPSAPPKLEARVAARPAPRPAAPAAAEVRPAAPAAPRPEPPPPLPPLPDSLSAAPVPDPPPAPPPTAPAVDETAELRARFPGASASDPASLRERVAELATIASHLQELEDRVSAAGGTDVLHLKDGRRLEGRIESESAEQVRLRFSLGSAAFPVEQIARIERNRGAATEFAAKYESARPRVSELVPLLAWCSQRSLAPQKELTAWAILRLDPDNAAARSELGYVKDGSGRWRENAAVQREAGKILWQGSWCTPEELSRRLRASGYVEMNGAWCERAPFSYKIDNLYRDEGKLILHGQAVQLQSRLQTQKDTVYDYQKRAWLPRTREVPVARYLGAAHPPASYPPPTPVGWLEVKSPGPIVDCRVKASAQAAKIGDRVTVGLSADRGGWPLRTLYTVSGPGANDSTYDATATLRGRAQFFIRFETLGDGMFLASDSNDLAVLEVKGTWARPVERLRDFTATAAAEAPAAAPTVASSEAAARAAEDAASPDRSFALTLRSLARSTQGLVHPDPVPLPDAYAAVMARLGNPLLPSLELMSRAEALELESWWAARSPAERRDFASFYVLWCARTRALATGGR